MSKTFYITTAIDYTNAAPHIGHAYEKILADVLVRYHRLKGDDSYFLTGVDQHGQKVQQAAAKEGISPEEFVTKTTAKFIELWEKLEISYDGWAATTDPLHKTCVQKILQDLYDRGDIYKAKYRGFYSVRQEQFLTDKERGEDGNFAPSGARSSSWRRKTGTSASATTATGSCNSSIRIPAASSPPFARRSCAMPPSA